MIQEMYMTIISHSRSIVSVMNILFDKIGMFNIKVLEKRKNNKKILKHF